MQKMVNEINIKMSKAEFEEMLSDYYYNLNKDVQEVKIELKTITESDDCKITVVARVKIMKQVFVFEEDRIVEQIIELFGGKLRRIITEIMDNEDFIIRAINFEMDDPDVIVIKCEPVDNYYESEKEMHHDNQYHYKYFGDVTDDCEQFFDEFRELTRNIDKEELKEHLNEVKDVVEKTVSDIIDKLIE